MDAVPEGYDVAKVEQWISENISELSPPLNWIRLEGGHSNLTYRIEDSSGKKAVIRRPPQGVLLPKAHDMSREWALISALGSGLWALGSGLWTLGSGLWALGSGLWALGSRL